MEITEVRIKLMESSEDRLRGFCSVTFDGSFVVRDLKIIDGNSGPFVAMPSRKLTSNCGKCRTKNHMRANYCNHCGQKLRHAKPQQGPGGRAKLYADIAHPINARCRAMIQLRVIQELEKEQALARQPGYQSRYDESYDSGPDVTPDELKHDEESTQKETGGKKPTPAKEKAPAAATPAKEVTRADAAHEAAPAPHSKENNSASPSVSNSSEALPKVKDDFGKGIFE